MNANLALCHRVVTHPKPKSRNQNYTNPKSTKTPKPKTQNYTQIPKHKAQMFWVIFGIGTYLSTVK